MKNARTTIVEVISHMLDNPSESGVYPTSTAYNQLEMLIEQERLRALAYSHANCCLLMDRDEDPRTQDMPTFISDARIALR